MHPRVATHDYRWGPDRKVGAGRGARRKTRHRGWQRRLPRFLGQRGRVRLGYRHVDGVARSRHATVPAHAYFVWDCGLCIRGLERLSTRFVANRTLERWRQGDASWTVISATGAPQAPAPRYDHEAGVDRSRASSLRRRVRRSVLGALGGRVRPSTPAMVGCVLPAKACAVRSQQCDHDRRCPVHIDLGWSDDGRLALRLALRHWDGVVERSAQASQCAFSA
jgi:hypothetical protein